MAARVPIRVKCAGALAVPLLMLSALAGWEVAAGSREAATVREQTDLATASIGPTGIISALHTERSFTGLSLLGVTDLAGLPVDTLEGARAATDAAIAEFRDEVAAKGGEVQHRYREALGALDRVQDERELVDGYAGPRSVTTYNETADRSFAGYSELVDTLVDATSTLSFDIEDSELRTGVELLHRSSRELDRVARFVRLLLLRSVGDDGRISSPAEVREAAALQNEAAREHEQILTLAVGPYQAAGDELRAGSDATGFHDIGRTAVETGDIDVPRLLDAISVDEGGPYHGFIRDVSGLVEDRASHLNDAARARQQAKVAVALLVLVVSLVAMPLFVRSLTRPIRRLTREAQDTARRRLPAAVSDVSNTPLGHDVLVPSLEPVHVDSHDEVGDLAATFNRAQATALELAVEQAVLRHNAADAFVSLARRNQNLVTRQIDYLTQLESTEHRPDALASLFVLDHQAARLRRLAESLLILAGDEPRRHGTTPTPIVDVARAAVRETADYRRVDLRDVRPATLAGQVVPSLTHLLAELIDNALQFSTPPTPVDIRGHHDRRGYELLVIDRGPGMPPAQIDVANRRLAGAEALTVAPSHYLGHYVTAALAARYGLHVELTSNGPGLTARVRVPAGLLADPPGLVPRHPLADRRPATLPPTTTRTGSAGIDGGAVPSPRPTRAQGRT